MPGPSEIHDRSIITYKLATVYKNFCANKDKLARLGVRVVLMREYGLDKIKVRNRPYSDRIYSQFGLEEAEGFIFPLHTLREYEDKKLISHQLDGVEWQSTLDYRKMNFGMSTQ